MYVYMQSIACPSCSVKNRSARFSGIFLCKFTSVLFPPGKVPVFFTAGVQVNFFNILDNSFGSWREKNKLQ